MVNLPQKVEIKIKDMPEVDKFTKKKRKARQGQIKVFQDAANSCRIGMFINLYSKLGTFLRYIDLFMNINFW